LSVETVKRESTETGLIERTVANLFPGYFALVMATGIISIAAHLLEMNLPAKILLFVNLLAYPILGILFLIRLTAFFPRVKADVTDHVRGPGFFTVVAGTCVLGSQLVIVAGQPEWATFLWLLGILFWAFFMYAFFTAVTVRENKPPLETGLSGAWLLAAVATQSVSVLGTLLANRFGAHRETLLFFTLCMFLLGCML
jgi:tellurite resistance protein TehA-like permease